MRVHGARARDTDFMSIDSRARDVTFSSAEVVLAGSLVVPDSSEPSPGVVMVGGSGAPDRNNDTYFPPIRRHLVQFPGLHTRPQMDNTASRGGMVNRQAHRRRQAGSFLVGITVVGMATKRTTSRNTTKTSRGAAREYLRVSFDRSGRLRSHDEQHAENKRSADEQGWRITEPSYKDVGSASRYARKAREGYDKLISDLKNGRFGADVLIIWESSRGSRRVGEWVLLIDLCDEHNVRVHVTTHGRTYDPSNPRDRRTLLEDAVDSEYESGKTSTRAKRAAAANAAEGKPHGRIPFGYKRVYDSETGRFVKQVPEPVEAKIIKELFKRLIKGHSLRSIAADFARRGITNDSGVPFSAQHLRSLALNPTYAAQRVHDPDRKGRKSSGTATIVDGNWKPLVSKADFLAVKAILTAPERVTTRPGRGVHLLSMIARCGECGGPLAARFDKERNTVYTCHARSCIRVAKAGLDTFAERAMLAYLARDDMHTALCSGTGDDEELARIRDDVASVRGEYDDLAEQVGSGRLSATLAAKAEPGILTRLRAAEARERELSTPNALAGLITPGKDVARRWKAAEMSTKREVARLLLSPDVVGELRVKRSPTPGHRCPVDRRVQWWKGEQEAASAA